jgi:hypothetical protein
MNWGTAAGQNWQAEGESFIGLLGVGMNGRMLESWCVVEAGVQTSFYRPREGEREEMNEYKLPAMKELQNYH